MNSEEHAATDATSLSVRYLQSIKNNAKILSSVYRTYSPRVPWPPSIESRGLLQMSARLGIALGEELIYKDDTLSGPYCCCAATTAKRRRSGPLASAQEDVSWTMQ